MRVPSFLSPTGSSATPAARAIVAERRRALSGSVFRACLVAGIVTNGLASAVRALIFPEAWLRSLLIWGVSALLVLPLVLLSKRSITVAGILFIGLFTGMITFLLLGVKDISVTAPMGFISIILLASFTFGRAGTFITLGLSSASALAWCLVVLPGASPSSDYVLTAIQTVYHFVNYAIYSYFYTHAMEASLGDAIDGHAREQALSAQLATANEQLEKKVEARTASLQEANEEMLAMNEELTSANELVTAMNSELSGKNAALSAQYEALRQLQRQVIASEKMASLGTLVAGMAHEINTPLGNSLTALSFMMDELQALPGGADPAAPASAPSAVLRSARIVQTNLDRAAALVRSLKTISADQHADDRREVEVREYLEEIVTSLSPSLQGTRHAVHVEGPPQVRVTTYPGALAQIITNLVMNSLQHGFAGMASGIITITFTCEADNLHVVYADDGAGMSEAVAAKAFDPFFTTRRDKGGTGLGLFIVHNLVTNRLGGTIRMDTAEGQGVRFEITMPRVGRENGQ